MLLYSKQQPIELIASMIRRDRLCHSFILTGGTGVGKKTVADYIAMQVLCQEKSGTPCGKCKSCRMTEGSAHPDIIKVQPSGKSGNYLVEDLRPIAADAAIASNEGGYKVYIIAGIDKALAAAQNILLKVFEEPPDHVIFIMTAKDRINVLPTILSRAVVINVPEASREDCLEALSDMGFSPDKAEKAYSVCGGSIGECLDYLGGEKSDNTEAVKRICEAIVSKDEYLLSKLLFDASSDKEGFLSMLSELSQLVLAAASIKRGGESSAKYRDLGDKLADNVRLSGLISMYDSINAAASRMLTNAQPALTASALGAMLIEAS